MGLLLLGLLLLGLLLRQRTKQSAPERRAPWCVFWRRM
jgi:hypothetical protein